MKWEYMIVEIGVDTSSSEERLKELGDNQTTDGKLSPCGLFSARFASFSNDR
jgi:hypothetical protein